jgi:hypothetical protein
LLEFDAPHGIGVQQDKYPVPLFALAKVFVFLLPLEFGGGSRCEDFQYRFCYAETGDSLPVDRH